MSGVDDDTKPPWGDEPEAEPAGAEGKGEGGEVGGAGDQGQAKEAPEDRGAAAAKVETTLVPAGLPEPSHVDDEWEKGVPEPDYAAEAARWRDELQAAVGVAERAEKKEADRKKKAAPASAAEVVPRVTDVTPRVADVEAEPVRRKARPARDDEEVEDRVGSGRWRTVGLAVLALGLIILVMIALGRWNARDYYLVCGAEEIRAERGRAFPPWGSRKLGGPEWQPISIPANAECEELETDDRGELEDAFLTALVDQANGMLTSRNPSNIELAEQQLQQALLLTRTADRRNQRKDIERLLGDVEYWRGAAHIQQVIDLLKGAAGRFDGAAVKRPRHTSDSSSWAGFARATAEELRLGPPELRPARPVDPNAPPPFTGTGPDSPVVMPDAGVGPDAGPGTLMNPPADATPSPPDAGLPRGGVLL